MIRYILYTIYFLFYSYLNNLFILIIYKYNIKSTKYIITLSKCKSYPSLVELKKFVKNDELLYNNRNKLYIAKSTKTVMITYNLDKIRHNAYTVNGYLDEVSTGTPIFKEKYDKYIIDESVTEKLSEYADKIVILAFSAEWCKDCHNNIPVLDLISEATGIEIRVFGHLMRDVKGSAMRWKVPPSPVEVVEFNVIKIPLIIVMNQNGGVLGEIVENPPEGLSLEEAILNIVEI